MKKMVLIMVMGLVGSLAVSFSVNAEVRSLRGDAGIADDTRQFTPKKLVEQKGGFQRSYKQQPPMIPHSTEKDEITLKANTCMRCHSEKNYKKEKAPKVGDSHFVSRAGKTLDTVSARRYFCNQCHAPQSDAPELVENSFVGAK